MKRKGKAFKTRTKKLFKQLSLSVVKKGGDKFLEKFMDSSRSD